MSGCQRSRTVGANGQPPGGQGSNFWVKVDICGSQKSTYRESKVSSRWSLGAGQDENPGGPMADLAIEGQRSRVPGVKSQYVAPIGLGSVWGILVPSLRLPSPAPSSPLRHESPMVRAMKVRRGKGWAGQSGGQESTDSGAQGRQLAGTRI